MGNKSTARQREGTAYHEAGHAVVSLELGFPVKRVTIAPSEDYLGICEGSGKVPSWLQPDEVIDARSRSWLERRIMVSLAGPLAERRWTGRRNNVGASGDYHHAVNFAGFLCGDEKEIEAFLAWLMVRTEGLLGKPLVWPAVEAVAAALLERETLTGREVRAAVRAAEQAHLREVMGAGWKMPTLAAT